MIERAWAAISAPFTIICVLFGILLFALALYTPVFGAELDNQYQAKDLIRSPNHQSLIIISNGRGVCPTETNRATLVTNSGVVVYGCVFEHDGVLSFVFEDNEKMDLPKSAISESAKPQLPPGHTDGPSHDEQPGQPRDWVGRHNVSADGGLKICEMKEDGTYSCVDSAPSVKPAPQYMQDEKPADDRVASIDQCMRRHRDPILASLDKGCVNAEDPERCVTVHMNRLRDSPKWDEWIAECRKEFEKSIPK